MNNSYVFTSESVSEGHPDKICDQVSDAILDYFLSHDPASRTAVECFVTTNRMIIGGEIRSTHALDPDKICDLARGVVRDIGYTQPGFHWENVKIECLLHKQSSDIAMGVDEKNNEGEGAGDQGSMFGYACGETESLMPAPITYAHLLLRELSSRWHQEPDLGLGPDAKSQVSLTYQDKRPVGLDAVVLSVQHLDNMSLEQVREIVYDHIRKVMPSEWSIDKSKCYINPTGRFVLGGPEGDAGLTGRKIIVDTYGGKAPHGGGAFSGKDPTKVDRSAAYVARYLAKNVVKAGLADSCLIQLSYAIGITHPVAMYLDCGGSERASIAKITKRLLDLVDLSPRGIRQHLKLDRPIFRRTACYGHFGRNPSPDGHFTWEKTDLVDELRGLL